MLAPLVGRLESRGLRLRVYAATAFGFFGLALVGTLFGEEYNFIFADGRAYYVYLPSAVIDGDLDFTNQAREHYRVGFNPLRENSAGHIFNKHPVGLALSLLPAFLVAHVVSAGLFELTGSPFVAEDGYSVAYQTLCLAAIMGFGLLTAAIADRWLAVRYALPGWVSAAAVLLFWIGSHYAYYYFREPFMVHVTSAFWVAAAASLATRVRDDLARGAPRPVDAFLLVTALSMAFVCRFTNAFLAVFVLDLLWDAWRRGALGGLGRCLLPAIAGLAPLALQVGVWRTTSGHMLLDPYDREGFDHWASPYLLSTLFSTRHGLLSWSPILVLAVPGLWVRLRRGGLGDPLLRGFASFFILLWYANSSWYAWWFGDAFGGRAFLELAGLFVLGLGFFLAEMARRGAAALRATLAFAALSLAWNWLLMLAWSMDWIRHGWDPF